jgi:large conductance mechanosensitive channel
MLKGFREFVLRGNVVDLAVAVVIGAALGALVTSFVDNFIKPLIQLIPGVGATGGLTLRGGAKPIVLGWGNFVSALITFVAIAAVVYFLIVVPMNRLAERRKRGEEPELDAPSEEIILLTEIRDALIEGRHRA